MRHRRFHPDEDFVEGDGLEPRRINLCLHVKRLDRSLCGNKYTAMDVTTMLPKCDRQHHLPAEPHQLIVSQSGQRGPEPEKQEQEEIHLDRKPGDVLDPGECLETDERHNRSGIGGVPTTQKQGGSHTGHQHHIGVLGDEEEGESQCRCIR